MAAANPLWGAPRIQGELLKLGILISERTVSRILPRSRKPPSQTWKAFIDYHVNELVSIDFFTVPTATFRVLFVLVVLAHRGRRVIHFNVTEYPTAPWTARQILEAFPEDTAPRYLIRDQDRIYGECFRNRLKDMGIIEVLTAPQSPRHSTKGQDSDLWAAFFAEYIAITFWRGTSDGTGPNFTTNLFGRCSKLNQEPGRGIGRQQRRADQSARRHTSCWTMGTERIRRMSTT
jgi:hypothetical protein